MKTALMWFRRDLRLTDNTALYQALRENDKVIGVFVLDDAILKSRDIGAARTAFLFGALQSLNAELEKHGGRLILRYGQSPDRELRTLAAETGATALYFNRDYTPYSTDRDTNVTAMLDAAGVDVISYDDALLAPPQNIVDPRDGRPFITFTPFKRVWETRVRVGARLNIAPLLPKLSIGIEPLSAPLPTLEEFGLRLTQTIFRGRAKRRRRRVCAGLPRRSCANTPTTGTTRVTRTAHPRCPCI